MKLQKLYSYTRKAIDDFQMIKENDSIAVGISGGKDSLTLLYALAGLRKFYPIHYSLTAVTVDLGYPDFDLTAIKELCQELDVPYHIIPTEIGAIIKEQNKKNSPCSLCAKLRKGALNQAVVELGCNKVAYAHHKDDIIETMLLSLMFEGRFYAFPPVTHLDRSNLDVIRPLMYVPEVDVIGFKNHYNLPIVKNPCAFDGKTQRQYAKDLLQQLNKDHPGVKNRLFTAILNGNIPDWRQLSNE
ncbi:ATP-binding protein [Thermoguttaceae bacterium LCP21S3_D4]|nr:tRNA 2-thiocytidine(32) synthetase TtcA [Lachnospiraceae bacterium]MDD6304283.1 ATP-binding protein [Lachnospiraceae bacterium]